MLRAFLRRLPRSWLDPEVVFLQPGSFEREVAALGLRTHVVPSGRLRNPRRTAWAVWKLGALLRVLQPDLVLSWAAKPHLYVAPAALLAQRRTSLAWWQHGIPDGHWMDRLATRLPAAAIGCSSHAAAAGQGRLRPRRRLFVVHPGIEEQPEERRSRPALRRALGLPQHAFLVGVVGRLQPDKGQDLFLRGLAELRARGREVHAVIVGGAAFGLSEDYAASLGPLVRALGLKSSVTFTGQVAEVAPYLRTMDVFVNPSARESFGIAIVEAMATGLTVINAARGGPDEIIEPGVSGIVLKSREPTQLADAIEKLMLDEQLRAGLAEGALMRAARFTADAMTHRLEAALAALVK